MHFVVPVIACAVLYLLAAPIDMARGQDFYAGLPSALASLRNLIEVSFAYGGGFGVLRTLERIWREIALVFIPAAVIAALAVAWIPRGKRPLAEVATWFSSLAVIGSAVLLWLAHASFGLLYPEDRTGIYFVPLATFAALGLVRILSQRPGVSHWIGIAIAVVLASFAIEFAAQWNVKSFWVWRYDADTKRIFQALEAAPKPPGTIRLGVSWVLEPSLNYYRAVRNATWMATVERDGFDGPRQFYVAIREDQHRPRWRKHGRFIAGRYPGRRSRYLNPLNKIPLYKRPDNLFRLLLNRGLQYSHRRLQYEARRKTPLPARSGRNARGMDREMTQQEIVRAIKRELKQSISQSYLSQIESGSRPHLTNATRMLLARFFKVHPGYLVDDPEGFHTELMSDVRVGEDQLDLWLIGGAERFAPRSGSRAARCSAWPCTKIRASACC